MGIGASRVDARILASKGELDETPLIFEASESVEFAGILFLLPSLLGQGLLDYKNHYSPISKGYYDLQCVVLIIAMMYLCRIKNPEQLKLYSPGELGKLFGLDRVPETTVLRKKLKEIISQGHAEDWNMGLAGRWVGQEQNNIFYVDGHVQVYNGYLANLGKKHVSRMKLCMPGMMEFWVNNAFGSPYFVVTGQVNEKLGEAIEKEIIPRLLNEVSIPVTQEELDADPDLPRFTLVFDREAYSPDFFKRLWDKHRVAVLTYRKNVKDLWEESDFIDYDIRIEENRTSMILSEKTVSLNGYQMREVRRLNKNGHQTSVITNNNKFLTGHIAIYMFARWTQENFFRYARQEYDLDRILQYTINEIEGDVKVVNPPYRKLSNKLKSLREKISRRISHQQQLIEQNINVPLDETPKIVARLNTVKEDINLFRSQEQELVNERKKYPYKIAVKDLPEELRYNKLDSESKLFQNIIKMICYRAESNFALILCENYKRKKNEMRSLVKNLIKTRGNIIPDYINNTLTVELFSLATPRDNLAVRNVCNILNQSETIYPGTELRMVYKTAT